MNLRIVAKNLTMSEASKDQVARRLHFALGRFSPAITSVDLTLRDENGPRRGVDKSCTIRVALRAAEDVVVEGRGDEVLGLVDRTAARAGRAVARSVDLRKRKVAVRTSGDLGGRRSLPASTQRS